MSVHLLEKLFCNQSKNMIGGSDFKISKENMSLLKIVFIIIIFVFIYNHLDKQTAINTNTDKTNTDKTNTENTHNLSKFITLAREYDYRTYNDDLTPPRKRDDYNIPPEVIYPNKYKMYTRGGPNSFKKVGYLNNKTADPGDPYKFLTLIGRQKYYNSNTYEYYVVSTNKDENIKFDLEKYKREIFSGDTVKVPQLNDVEYEATIDKVLEYEYNPYDI